MPTTDLNAAENREQLGSDNSSFPEPEYHAVLVESPNVFVSLVRGLREWSRQPRVNVPRKYYGGEVRLPVVEMAAWYNDLPSQLRQLPDLSHYYLLRLGRRLHLLPKSMEVPDIWQDFKQQPASWANSLLVHFVVLVALVLPYIVARLLHQAPKPAEAVQVVDISPYLPQLAPSPKKAGGGGGGGDRTPTPPSKGAVPKFAMEQFTPPMAKLPNPAPKLPMQPTLLGPAELKVPQIASNLWGDPMGVNGPPSNGPGSGGGIGTGSGGGIGSGTGGGLGPGSGGGVGGGAFAVGGDVTEPIPIYDPDPPYSEEARKAKYEGTVTLKITVDAQGAVRDVQVVKPLGLGLDEKAIETVRTWKFKAGRKNGIPVTVWALVEVTFHLL